MTAKGKTVISAVNGLNIDVKQVNQETVSQVIDTMVTADPSLSWLKDAEARGDVNWQQVKEVHDSFKYSSSGLGAGAEIVLAIALSVAMGPAGMGLSSTTAAAAGSLATTATNSAITNKGDFGQILKDTASISSLKNAAVAVLTAGVGEQLPIDPTVFSTATLAGAAQTALEDAVITTALEGGSFGKNFIGAAAGQGLTIAGATLANDISGSSFAGGQLTKVGLHAVLGGLLSVAQGSSFASGALAAGGDEALVGAMAGYFAPDIMAGTGTATDRSAEAAKLLAASQLVGAVAAAITGGNPGMGAAVANNATEYNFLGPISAAKRDAARAAMEAGTATADQQAYFRSSEEKDQRSDYLRDKVANYEALTPAEEADWDTDQLLYLNEMTSVLGSAGAQAGLASILQNGVIKTYDYPFAGTAEQKAAWTQQNSQGLSNLLSTQFRSESGDEKLYNNIGQGQLIAKAQDDDNKIGQLAFLPEAESLGILALGPEIFGKGVIAGAADGEVLGAKGVEGAGKLLEDASQQLEEYIGTFGKYKPPTVIGAVDPLTGKIVTTSSGAVPDVIAPELEAYAESLGGLGVKTACGNTLGRCAEFRAPNELLLSNPKLKLGDIKFTPAIRPRTGEVVPRCENCTNIFGVE